MKTHEELRSSSIRWRKVFGFTLLPFSSRGKSPQYPLDRRINGLRSWSLGYEEENNLTPALNRTLAIQPAAFRHIDSIILDLVIYVGQITCAHVLFRGASLSKDCTVFCRSIVGPGYG
jgi:hypothetical protein